MAALKFLAHRHVDVLLVLLVILTTASILSQVLIHNPADRPVGLIEATIACFTAWLSEYTRKNNKEREAVSQTAIRAEAKADDHEGRIETLEDAERQKQGGTP